MNANVLVRALLEDDFEFDVKADLIGGRKELVWATVSLYVPTRTGSEKVIVSREDALLFWSSLPSYLSDSIRQHGPLARLIIYRNKRPEHGYEGVPVPGREFNRLAKSLVFSPESREAIGMASEMVVASSIGAFERLMNVRPMRQWH